MSHDNGSGWICALAAGAALVTGCGGGGDAPPDAVGVDVDARTDATPDAAPCGSAATGEVTVMAPLAGAYVVYSDGDGCMLGRSRANAFGVAHGPAVAGGMLTLILPALEPHAGTLTTVTGIQPGDAIDLTVPPQVFPPESYDLAIDGEADPTSLYVTIYTGGYCGAVEIDGGFAPPAGMSTPRCTDADDTIAVLAFDFTTAGILQWSAAEDVALDASGTTAVTLPPWRTDFVDRVVTVTNPSPDDIELDVATAPVEDGITFVGSCEPCANYLAAFTGTPSVTTRTPAAFGDGIDLAVRLVHAGAVPGQLALFRSQGAAGAAITLDAPTDLLPIIDAAGWDRALERPVLTWSAAAAPTSADDVTVVLQGPTGAGYVTWSVIGPAAMTAPRLPDLPADLRPTLTPDLTVTATLLDYSDVDGYDAARLRPGALRSYTALGYDGWPIYQARPAGFTARVSESFTP